MHVQFKKSVHVGMNLILLDSDTNKTHVQVYAAGFLFLEFNGVTRLENQEPCVCHSLCCTPVWTAGTVYFVVF